MVVNTCDQNSWETEAGGLWTWGPTGVQRETLHKFKAERAGIMAHPSSDGACHRVWRIICASSPRSTCLRRRTNSGKLSSDLLKYLLPPSPPPLSLSHTVFVKIRNKTNGSITSRVNSYLEQLEVAMQLSVTRLPSALVDGLVQPQYAFL